MSHRKPRQQNSKMESIAVTDTTLKLSIIVPVRNSRDYLSKCVEGIKSSSFTAYELIIVDDASDEDISDIQFPIQARILRLPFQSGPAYAAE